MWHQSTKSIQATNYKHLKCERVQGAFGYKNIYFLSIAMCHWSIKDMTSNTVISVH